MNFETIKNELQQAAANKELATRLNNYIEEFAKKDGFTRERIISELAVAATIQKTTVGQILKGKIKNPPQKRLEGFAKYFGQNI